MNLVQILDDTLNRFTMYRLLVYGLGVLAAAAILFGFTGRLSLSGPALIASLITLLAFCYASNWALARLWSAPTNSESWLITALILFCILPPSTQPRQLTLIALGGLLAMASKYVVALRRKHLFNPAAFGAIVLGLSGLLPATWWIGTPIMLPLTLLVGLVIVRKIRRFQLLVSFLVASLAVMLLVGLLHDRAVLPTLGTAFTSWPLVFFGTIMLTEPTTLPPRRRSQIIYGLLAGGLFSSQLHAGTVATTPEVALIIANGFSYIVSPKFKLRLTLKAKVQLAPNVYDLSFTPDRRFSFLPGQYLEWTLPHRRTDSRGNRRTFTIASAPTEPEVHLGVKLYEPSSSFKTALMQLQPGAKIMAGELGGDFTLPPEPAQKLVFIAGGIGITPFRSMIQNLIDTKAHRDITLFYLVSNPAELSYQTLLKSAQPLGVRLVPVVGSLTPELLKRQITDYTERRFYLSGPNAMVEHYAPLLHQLGIPRRHIVTDYFSGY